MLIASKSLSCMQSLCCRLGCSVTAFVLLQFTNAMTSLCVACSSVTVCITWVQNVTVHLLMELMCNNPYATCVQK